MYKTALQVGGLLSAVGASIVSPEIQGLVKVPCVINNINGIKQYNVTRSILTASLTSCVTRAMLYAIY